MLPPLTLRCCPLCFAWTLTNGRAQHRCYHLECQQVRLTRHLQHCGTTWQERSRQNLSVRSVPAWTCSSGRNTEPPPKTCCRPWQMPFSNRCHLVSLCNLACLETFSCQRNPPKPEWRWPFPKSRLCLCRRSSITWRCIGFSATRRWKRALTSTWMTLLSGACRSVQMKGPRSDRNH